MIRTIVSSAYRQHCLLNRHYELSVCMEHVYAIYRTHDGHNLALTSGGFIVKTPSRRFMTMYRSINADVTYCPLYIARAVCGTLLNDVDNWFSKYPVRWRHSVFVKCRWYRLLLPDGIGKFNCSADVEHMKFHLNDSLLYFIFRFALYFLNIQYIVCLGIHEKKNSYKEQVAPILLCDTCITTVSSLFKSVYTKSGDTNTVYGAQFHLIFWIFFGLTVFFFKIFFSQLLSLDRPCAYLDQITLFFHVLSNQAYTTVLSSPWIQQQRWDGTLGWEYKDR